MPGIVLRLTEHVCIRSVQHVIPLSILCFGAQVFVTVKNRWSLIGFVIILFKDDGCLPGVGGMWLFLFCGAF